VVNLTVHPETASTISMVDLISVLSDVNVIPEFYYRV
jgi:hypothetical protein